MARLKLQIGGGAITEIAIPWDDERQSPTAWETIQEDDPAYQSILAEFFDDDEEHDDENGGN